MITPKQYVTHPSLCPVPWTSIYYSPKGFISDCSISDHRIYVGTVNTIDEAINHPTHVALKEKMAQGEKISACRECWRVEQYQPSVLNGLSNRTHFKKTIKITDLSIFDKPTNFELNAVDIRWSNICNLACVLR
jgi:radical SAM protein with 4Fe4S-binding SPASM domain